jgi:hypothetical protein
MKPRKSKRKLTEILGIYSKSMSLDGVITSNMDSFYSSEYNKTIDRNC